VNCCGVAVSPAAARRALGHRSNVAGVLDDLTWTPERDELVAIDKYVRELRPRIPEFPALKPLIESWEGWYGALDAIDLSPLKSSDTLGEAKRRRTAINNAMGAKLPDTWVPADGPQTPPEAPHHDLDPFAALKSIALVAGLVVAGYVALKLA
jgi:hypothetical protein